MNGEPTWRQRQVEEPLDEGEAFVWLTTIGTVVTLTKRFRPRQPIPTRL